MPSTCGNLVTVQALQIYGTSGRAEGLPKHVFGSKSRIHRPTAFNLGLSRVDQADEVRKREHPIDCKDSVGGRSWTVVIARGRANPHYLVA